MDAKMHDIFIYERCSLVVRLPTEIHSLRHKTERQKTHYDNINTKTKTETKKP